MRYLVRSSKADMVFEVAAHTLDEMPIERAIRLAKQDPRIGEILEVVLEGEAA